MSLLISNPKRSARTVKRRDLACARPQPNFGVGCSEIHFLRLNVYDSEHCRAAKNEFLNTRPLNKMRAGKQQIDD